MSDYIKREDAYSTLTDFYHHKREIQHESLRYALNNVPSADVAPVRHGRWVVKKFGLGDEFECMVCSVCGGEALCIDVRGTDWLMQEESNYCPNCGAKMGEEKDDEL